MIGAAAPSTYIFTPPTASSASFSFINPTSVLTSGRVSGSPFGTANLATPAFHALAATADFGYRSSVGSMSAGGGFSSSFGTQLTTHAPSSTSTYFFPSFGPSLEPALPGFPAPGTIVFPLPILPTVYVFGGRTNNWSALQAPMYPGTRQVPFAKIQDKTEMEGRPHCLFSSLPAMPQYTNKNIEELRWVNDAGYVIDFKRESPYLNNHGLNGLHSDRTLQD